MDVLPSEPIYENVGDNSDELARAMRVCLMGGDVQLPLTCVLTGSGEKGFQLDWEAWRSTLFAKVLAPHLIRVANAAKVGDVRQIVRLDRALGERLSTEVGDRSAVAGSQFHSSMDGARHVKALDKLQKAVVEQKIAGHHATFFACEAAVFNVPMIHLLPAFLFAEWRSARNGAGIPAATSTLELFWSQSQDALADARKLFFDTNGGEGSLSVCA